MLRALGIVFIVCSVMFVGLFMLTIGWWAIASGAVKIAGINDDHSRMQDPVPDHDGGNRSHRSRDPGPEKSPGDGDRVAAAHIVDSSPVPDSFDPAAASSQYDGVRFASSSGSPRLTTASLTTGLATVSFDPTPEERAGALLQLLASLRLVQISGDSPALSWPAGRGRPALFPAGTRQIGLEYTHRAGGSASLANIQSELKDLVDNHPDVAKTMLLSAGGAGVTPAVTAISGDAFRLVYDATLLPANQTVAVGLVRVSVPTESTVVVQPNATIVTPAITSVFNGRFEPEPGTAFATAVSSGVTVYDLVRVRLAVDDAARVGFFLQRIAADGSALPSTPSAPNVLQPVAVDRVESVGRDHREFLLTGLDEFPANSSVRLIAVAEESGRMTLSDPLTLSIVADNTRRATGSIVRLSVANETPVAGQSELVLRRNRVVPSLQLTSAMALDHIDAVVRSTDNNRILAAGRINRSSTSKQSLGVFDFPSSGPRRLRLEMYQGGRALELQDGSVVELPVQVFEQGPTVSLIDPRGFSFTSATENALRIVFEPGHPLMTAGSEAGRVENAAHYDVVKPDGTTVISAGKSVAYDAGENTVVLSWTNSTANGSYRLTINSGLSDAAGLRLQSSTAQPNGSRYTVSISKESGSTLAIDELVTSTPSEQRGLSHASGPYVTYQEYTDPRQYPVGFNPSDKVVTRVARLYYFRDAHRVAQIINRKATSYNRASVDMKQQFADAKRRETELVTAKRRELENVAVRAAQQSRAAENALDEQQRALMLLRESIRNRESELTSLDNQIASLKVSVATAPPDDPRRLTLERMEATRETVRQDILNAEGDIRDLEARIRALMARVQVDRDVEIRATAEWEKADQEEARRLTELFQREVAAKTEDPDTYAPGVPDSNDPVEQVSVSVVGEGLIQLRGPRKGVNEVHKMINELDSPVGQVKVAIHTVQVNGEGGDRMEEVVHRIQRYLDHSRFLTLQSAQMLRNAVVTVASRRAAQVMDLCPPGMPQELRDYKYQEAFFGAEFVQELKTMDSEFLKTGNKVLSLHSMDTTSLANALFLMALAKNDVREEILAEFMTSVQCRLPQYEIEYYQGSAPKPDYHDLPLKERLFSRQAHRDKMAHNPPFRMMAQNAQFASLRGLFDAQIVGPDTISPMQREFLRLAQIFKARLITEVELRQRVMERSLIEERIGTPEDYSQELARAKTIDQAAQETVAKIEAVVRGKAVELVSAVKAVRAQAQWAQRELSEASSLNAASQQIINKALETLQRLSERTVPREIRPEVTALQTDLFVTPSTVPLARDQSSLAERSFEERFERYRVGVTTLYQKSFKGPGVPAMGSEEQWDHLRNIFESSLRRTSDISSIEIDRTFREALLSLDRIEAEYILAEPHKSHANAVRRIVEEDSPDDSLAVRIDRLNRVTQLMATVHRHIAETTQAAAVALESLAASLQRIATTGREVDRIPEIIADWQAQVARFGRFIRADSNLSKGVLSAEQGFEVLEGAYLEFLNARHAAERARRPLDHKKFLDMLIDDVEEKYIELVEGTRAQTANIDNYLQRLSTALEDDFNTQFYHPAFRYVREASYFYDVSVGQVETTSVVANNRAFAKVSPQATMEFDLPKRDILINEAMNSALAAYNDYGALLSDPNFLALTRLYGGQPASATYGNAGASPYIQEVLPGLPSGTDAQFLTSPQNNTPRVGANLEALIPDPAIYKFETGTGYEVRPVIQPDGQAVVFHFNYMYTTNIREPVRADEKHLGRVKRHFIDTDVVSGNYELREVSTYRVGLKAARSSRGVPFLEDVPGVGVLFRPQVSEESSLQQNIVLSQTVIYPTLFDLMGLRWAPAVADLDSLSLREREFVTRNREKVLRNEVFDYSSIQVDDFLRIPEAERRGDLYRTQETIPSRHPNSYQGPGLNLQDGVLREGFDPEAYQPPSQPIPGNSGDARFPLEEMPRQPILVPPGTPWQMLPPVGQPVPGYDWHQGQVEPGRSNAAAGTAIAASRSAGSGISQAPASDRRNSASGPMSGPVRLMPVPPASTTATPSTSRDTQSGIVRIGDLNASTTPRTTSAESRSQRTSPNPTAQKSSRWSFLGRRN